MITEFDIQEEIPICDFWECSNPIRAEDYEYSPPTKRLCDKHGAEFDEINDNFDVKKIMAWWVKSMGGAENALKK